MTRNNIISVVKVCLFIACLTPFVALTWGLFHDQLGANPVEVIIRSSGLWALKFLLITLLVTPLKVLTGISEVVRFRRMLGLFVFFYALVHMLLYLGLDQSFDVQEIIKDIIKRPFITIGFFSFLALVPLAFTSTNKMMKKLGGRRWKQLHKLVYVIGVAACIHFLMLVKADIREPIIYIVMMASLLAVRVVFFYRKKNLITKA